MYIRNRFYGVTEDRGSELGRDEPSGSLPESEKRQRVALDLGRWDTIEISHCSRINESTQGLSGASCSRSSNLTGRPLNESSPFGQGEEWRKTKSAVG